jgi:hypothetical protein
MDKKPQNKLRQDTVEGKKIMNHIKRPECPKHTNPNINNPMANN